MKQQPSFKDVFRRSGELILDDFDEEFIARHRISTNNGVVAQRSPAFYKWFLKDEGKIEPVLNEDCERMPLYIYQSTDLAMWDHYTLSLLGGSDAVETSLRDVYSIAYRYRFPSPVDRGVSTHGEVNCFYVRDQYKVLRRVCISMTCRGWAFFAHPIFRSGRGIKPKPGTRFFSTLEISTG